LISTTVKQYSQNSVQATHDENMCLNQKKFSLAVVSLLIISLLFLMGGCASLPPNSDSPKTYALQDTTDTRLGKKYLALKKGHAEESGFLLLGNALDAFTARLVLAQDADRSIDAQYYCDPQRSYR